MSDPVSVIGLGVAIFSAGQPLVTSGGFQSTSDTPSFMHPKKPDDATWDTLNAPLDVIAWNPRIGLGWQTMKFRLIYEYNGYDLRNARVEPLVDASSGMYASSFTISWRGQAHSHAEDTVLQIVFNISGQWNPVGRGHVSFYGKLIISASKTGPSFEEFSITSEQDWVRVASR